ncbi:alpha/beta fold hydrolase [Paraburkholderia flava]|uniref:alpha/beta fold hydrolase n=1 Tax=Paraburkholderia flava TaxID=2547393 RepID=UPI00105FA659|nr:alpha/beta hydrolase [Paraburkholderia flava]
MSTWILLRGLTREVRHWGPLPALLRDTAGVGEVLRIDLPGNGVFAQLRSPADVARTVGFVRLAALQSGAPGPYRLFAMSLGGMVATAWAQQYPREIERLVLINTSMRPFSRVTERLRPRAWPTLLHVALQWRNAPAAEEAIHRLTCNRHDTWARDLAEWIAIREHAPVSRINALSQLWAAARFSASATPPGCPTLVLSSDADQLVNPVCSAKLATAWDAPHIRHPWAGHDLPHDDAEWVVRAVTSWLKQSAGALPVNRLE